MKTETFIEIAADILETELEEEKRTGDKSDSSPREGASSEAIEAAEKARGRIFGEAYKAFLGAHNGWDHFEWGLSLFGTLELAEADDSAYQDAEETLSYDEDQTDEIKASMIIGSSEDNATLILLLESGEVIEYLYAEEARFPDLSSFLRERKKTLLRMRESAIAAIARTKREWKADYRASDNAALTKQLRELLAGSSHLPERVDPQNFVDPSATPTPCAQALRLLDEDGDCGAHVELGLVLYLGAAPSPEEVVKTFRAFRKHFPFEGPLKWQLASPSSFFSEDCEDPDAEPFADKLTVDDQGYCGLRVSHDRDERSFILNVRGIPPRLDGDGDDDDDDDESASAEDNLARQASFVEVLVPASEDPGALRALCIELTEILPVRSGHGGYFARALSRRFKPDPWDEIFRWCRRYFNVEPCYVDGWLREALTRHRGAGWLTVLGKPFVDALGETEWPSAVSQERAANGLVLTAGELTLGDIHHGQLPYAVAEVARIISPVSLSSWSTRGTMSVGGVWFATSASQLPGAFANHHATESFLRRFEDPATFVGPSAREVALEIIERMCARMNKAALEKFRGSNDSDPRASFSQVMRALHNGAYHVHETEPDLSIEALAMAARFPDWSPHQTYNNLLGAYLRNDRLAEALDIVEVAIASAKKSGYAFTLHNAACALSLGGRLDEALQCLRIAKALNHPHWDKIEVDDDLVALRDTEGWRELFVAEAN